MVWPFIVEEDKSRKLSDIELSEVSLVDKAANRKKFLIFKRDTAIEGESFEKEIPIFISKADQRIVSGIVYEPDVEDSQGDTASAEEIRKAAYDFMQNVQKFKINHKKSADVKVLESYIAPTDLTIEKQKVKKGSWILTVRVLNKKLWEAVKSGSISGFSMAGEAVRKDDGDGDDPFPSLAMTQGGDLVNADNYDIEDKDDDDEDDDDEEDKDED